MLQNSQNPPLKYGQVWQHDQTGRYFLVVRMNLRDFGFLWWEEKLNHYEVVQMSEPLTAYDFISNDEQCFWNSIRNKIPYG